MDNKKLSVSTFLHKKGHILNATIMPTKTQLKADDNMTRKGIIQDNLTKSDLNLEIKSVMEEMEVYRVIC